MGEQSLGLAREMKGFAPVAGAAGERKRMPGHAPFAGEQGDDRRIGPAVFGRGAHGNPQRHAAIGLRAQAFDCVAPSAGMGGDADANAAGSKTER